MGVGGQHRVDLRPCARGQRSEQTRRRIERAPRLLAHVQAQVERHLVVARSGGMQHAGRLAERAGEPRLDGHVHVLFRGQRLRVGIPQLHQLAADGERGLPRDDSAAREHGEVREAAGQVLAQELPVERKRAGEGEHFGQEPALAGGLGLRDDHFRSPPWRRLNSRSESPSRVMNPSAALWSNLSCTP